MPLRRAASSPPQPLDPLHRIAKTCRTDHPISYLDTLEKTGRSESIEATLRKRRILFAGLVARMEDTRLLKYVMFGELVWGAVSAGGQEKEWIGCLLDDLRAFGIQTDQWGIAAQDPEEWNKTVKQGAEFSSRRNGSRQREPRLH